MAESIDRARKKLDKLESECVGLMRQREKLQEEHRKKVRERDAAMNTLKRLIKEATG